jgi:hypothetical protein
MMSIRDQVIHIGKKYLPIKCAEYFYELPIPTVQHPDYSDMSVTQVALPEWASDLGLGDVPSLSIPSNCISTVHGDIWRNVDWWRAAFDLATCRFEQEYEIKHGVLHSYSHKLPREMEELWSRAWVNRILLFIRRWASQHLDKSENELFGPVTGGRVLVTHDVDYVSKTFALRIKQSAFIKYNILKSIARGDWTLAGKLLKKLFVFPLSRADYWQFEQIRTIEKQLGILSIWNLYAGPGGFGRSPSELLLDPAYKVSDPALSSQLKSLCESGNHIGLHQSFHSWQDPQRMLREKNNLEKAIESDITICRQHWLRFSFADTWKAQEEAGFRLDTTLGFNDRPGFRNSSALTTPAWISSERRFSSTLDTIPMILMDSHLFDYRQMGQKDRESVIDNYLDEIAFVDGEASIIWHQRVFHEDYGWGADYQYLLEGIKSRKLVPDKID